MSKSDGTEGYAEEIERKIRAKVIEDMPSFQPNISLDGLKELQNLPKDQQAIALMMMRAQSISDQRFMWLLSQLIKTNQAQREHERESVEARGAWGVAGTFVIQAIVSALTAATAVFLIHPK